MAMDFSSFKIPKIANKRKDGGLPPKVQEYTDLKYRKAEQEKDKVKSIGAKFTVANDKFDAIGLASHALSHTVNPANKAEVFVLLVNDKDGKYLKARKNKEKGHSFKSDAMEIALGEAGIIDPNAIGKNQFINMTSVAKNVSIDGVSVLEVFQLSKGEAKPKVEKEVKATVAATETSAPAVATPTAAPAVAGGDPAWD